MQTVAHAVLLAAVAIMSAACAPSSYARASDGRTKADPAPADKSRLVLTGVDFRSVRADIEPVLVADGDGEVVGAVGPGMWLRVDVEPGPRTLVAWHGHFLLFGRDPTALCGDFAAGTTYFLAVGAGPKTEPMWAVDTSPDTLSTRDVALVLEDRRGFERRNTNAAETREAVARGKRLAEEGKCTAVHPSAGRRFQ
jgi:hypothetical protein